MRSRRFLARLFGRELEVLPVARPRLQVGAQEELHESLDRQSRCTGDHSHEDHVGRGKFRVGVEDLSVVDVFSLGELVRVAELAHEDQRKHGLENDDAKETVREVHGRGLTQLSFVSAFRDFICLGKVDGGDLDTESRQLGMKDDHVDLEAYEEECKE